MKSSSHIVQPLVILTILSGPDAGVSLSFRKSRISIGRDESNDFVLSDGFVSNHHGEVSVSPGDFKYSDLKSRHGSMVVVNNISEKLNNRKEVSTIAIQDGAELQIGSSIVRFQLPEMAVQRAPTLTSSRKTTINIEDTGIHSDGLGNEKLITAGHEPVKALTRKFEKQDVRMGLVFRLAERLNALTTLDEILDLIVETCFEAFPAASFFSISLVDQTENSLPAKPYLMRAREGKVGADETPILSMSIIRRVVDIQESVLWVKDSMGGNVSQSILEARITACLCAPLVGQRKLIGVMQLDTRGRGALFSQKDLELFSVFASNAAFALERAELADSIVNMFESFVDASVTAIEARDPTTAGHSHRVSAYTLELAKVVHSKKEGPFADVRFSAQQMTELRYGTLLHDFGKITVPVEVLQKATRLPELHLDLLLQRLETVKATHSLMIWEAFARALASGTTQNAEAALQEVEARCEVFSRQIDETAAWIGEVNIKGFLPDADIERMEATARTTWRKTSGVVEPILTPNELENLTIRRGTLNASEWEVMKGHSAQSQRFLEKIPWGEDLALIPYLGGAHHEKLDGSGYPLALTATELNVQVRMLTVADIFDALTAADRPYRKAATVERAVEILRMESEAGKLDAELVEVFEKDVIPNILHLIPSYSASSS